MSTDRFQAIEALYHAARARPAKDRAAFLAGACVGDDALRREVESLLAADEGAASLLKTAAAWPRASLTGRRLGAYEIVGLIGAGGMGEVYRARDTKLDRDVAIKVLPPAFANDADRLARFTREAKTLAALNHPNIAQIYGIEESSVQGPGSSVRALVMELVEGEDLSTLIAGQRPSAPAAAGPSESSSRGPAASGGGAPRAINIEDALPIARQIADALEAAHEQGIIHRDLKPANIKVRADGTVKVLDFGLAKAIGPEGAMAADAMNSPTMMSPAMTEMGMILGTAAYMAPEQARGKAVDKRADIWAFGAVFYEILTGRRAFNGDDVTTTLAAVLKDDVNWEVLPADVPPAVGTLLRRCLERDPKRRLRDIGDARVLIEDVLSGAVSDRIGAASAPATPASRRRERMAWLAIAGACLMAGGVAVWFLKPPPATHTIEARFDYVLPEPQQLSNTGRRYVAISPDGTRLVYVADNQLYLRELNEVVAQPIPGTHQQPLDPVFSPDGHWIAYYSVATRSLNKIPVAGGTPVPLAPIDLPFGMSWHNGEIAVGQNNADTNSILAVPEVGGTPRTLVTIASTELAVQPQLLDDGRHVLFAVAKKSGARSPDDADIVVAAIDGGARTVLVRGATSPRLLPDGRLIYFKSNSLFAAMFDARRLTLHGGAVPVLSGVAFDEYGFNSGAGEFDVADTGTLVFAPDSGAPAPPRPLVLVDRQGHEEEVGAPPQAYRYPRVSPDGTRLAVSIDDGDQNLWIWDFAQRTLRRLTFEKKAGQWYAAWTPDSRDVFYAFQVEEGIWRVAANGTGKPEQVVPTGYCPCGVSPDASSLVYKGNGGDIMLLPLKGDTHTARPLIQIKFRMSNFEISPNGKWLAYESYQSGQQQVYVRPFPSIEGDLWQVSPAGGVKPLWSRDGRELFYVQPDQKLMVVAVQTAGAFTYGRPQTLLDTSHYEVLGTDYPGRTYDIAPDGKRFLMIKKPEDTKATRPVLTIITNWLADVEAKVK